MSAHHVLILGGRSDIGRAIAAAFAAQGHPVQLAVRDVSRSERDRADLQLRYGVPVTVHEFDALATETHEAFVRALPSLPVIAVCAVGVLGVQAAAEGDVTEAVRVMRSNYEGPASIMGVLAGQFAERGSGTLVGISSVAGVRGRASNYIYGSAKAGFTAYLSGLRQRLYPYGVRVITVLPGYVATQMTAALSLPAALTAQPQEVARAVLGAVRVGRNIVYVRPVWRIIACLLRAVPERVFARITK